MKTQVFEKDVVGKTIEAVSTNVTGVVISFTDDTFLWGIGTYCESVNFTSIFNAEEDACQECVRAGILTQAEFGEIVLKREIAQEARRDADRQRLARLGNEGLDATLKAYIEDTIRGVEQSIGNLRAEVGASE